jgi:hypothetical protein
MGTIENMLPVLIRAVAPLLFAISAFGQYKADPIGPPPAEVAPGIAQTLGKTGFKISNNSGPYCEVWFRTSVPSGPAKNQQNVTLPNIPLGTLLGVIRFDGNGYDRREQTIPAGLYTLRYGIMPMNDAHLGAAPRRDFLLMTPAEEDKDLNSTPDFDALVGMSRKASRSPHPAVLSFWRSDSDSPGFSEQGESDWVLQTKVGDIPIAVILVGTAN